ncbi:serine hydrolase domain-containing protein [Flagellimonas eckloniae]|uniref:D-alanyl-D-alanine carboxypeptidase n=1 Tax=Flagellimonas eckloniae TaxID=346185 RepID=A0A0Q0XLH2_9FLAO|nr:serine hydrolase domain-containing protein [Allomuricauda eckloniae]KQC29870.1 D-alanyl-D-alanine carboxypeptidase [Allomuricauda eckloniae]
MNSLLSYLKSLFDTNLVIPLDNLQGFKKYDALLHNLAAESKVPGMSVTILKQGQTVLEKGYGYADLERKTRVDSKSTVFRIASISKCITGIALGKMVEEEIVNLDASFYEYVPYYPKKKYDFTLRQLAGHTAGIRGYRGKEYALNKPYSIKDSIEIFKDDPLVFEPGKGYLYNSFDFVLLSLAMQEASGIPFESYVKEKVFDPLEMSNTFHSGQVERSRKTAEFYTKAALGFKKATQVNNFYKLAGGGYLSTSGDIAKFGQAILEQKLLKSDTYKSLLTSQTVNEKSTYYGLGFQVSTDNFGRSFVGHVGNSIGAYSNFFLYPNENLVVSILINCTDPKIQKDLDELPLTF